MWEAPVVLRLRRSWWQHDEVKAARLGCKLSRAKVVPALWLRTPLAGSNMQP